MPVDVVDDAGEDHRQDRVVEVVENRANRHPVVAHELSCVGEGKHPGERPKSGVEHEFAEVHAGHSRAGTR